MIRPSSVFEPPFDEAKARAVAGLTAWDSLGPHGTGTTGDEAGARWLAAEAVRLGAEVTTEVFELGRLHPVACYLELDGERIPGMPAFDAAATGPNGLTGALNLSDHRSQTVAAIGFTGEHERLRRDSARHALVILCSGARPGLGLLNAEQFKNPYGAPTIHLSSEAGEAVFAAVTRVAPPESSQKADMFPPPPVMLSSQSGVRAALLRP
jgi:hypothetical protein